MIDTILLIIALVCFGAATLNAQVKLNLIALGLFCWCLTGLI